MDNASFTTLLLAGFGTLLLIAAIWGLKTGRYSNEYGHTTEASRQPLVFALETGTILTFAMILFAIAFLDGALALLKAFPSAATIIQLPMLLVTALAINTGFSYFARKFFVQATKS